MSSQTIAVPQEPVAPPVTPEPPTKAKLSVQEYLEMERRTKVRHEYVNGEIIAIIRVAPRGAAYAD